jgi:predicted Na+-dependent transporter
MLRGLAWLGVRAQWVLALGVIGALVLPGPGELLKGTIPFWVALLIGLTMVRIDLGAVARRSIQPRRLARNIGLCLLLMAATPTLLWAAGTGLGLSQSHIDALVYTSSGPPLGSSAALCFLLGLDAAFALELTVIGSFLAPVSMPLVARGLLGDAVPIESAEMAGRLALLIGAATVCAVVVRRILGPPRIERHRLSFDGLAALTMIMFLFPLFLGMMDLIRDQPGFALATFALVIAANIGIQIVALPGCRLVAGHETGGATALMWGNRNAGLSLAALPDNPLFTLYVALYQFPMYFTPLVMRPLMGRPRN